MSKKSWLKETWREVYCFTHFFWQRLQASQWQLNASALTYTSLFALVPILTVSFSALSMLPQLANAQGYIAMFIFSHFLPDTGYQIWDYLQQFSQQTRKLTMAGILMLIATALMMLKTIENTFNNIWKVKQGRRGVDSFLLYWAVLSLGPILLGAGLMFSTYLLSLHFFSGVKDLGVLQPLLHLIPLLFTTAALCLIYCAVPNCRVPLKHALTGALVAALIFELTKSLFAYGISHSSYKLIYGAFAAVPLFLTWIYLCWGIVLFGAVLVQSLSTYHQTDHQNTKT